MKLSEKIIDAMNDIDDDLLKESEQMPKQRRSWRMPLISMTAAAAAFAVIIYLNQLPKYDAGMSSESAVVTEGAPESEEESRAYGEKEADTDGIKDEEILTVKIIIRSGSEEVSAEIYEAEYARLVEAGYQPKEDGKMLFLMNSQEMKEFPQNESYTYELVVIQEGD